MHNNWQLFLISKLNIIVVEENHSNIIGLRGEIVGIYEKEEKRFAKILYEEGFVDISLNDIQDVYLGDKVIVHSDLTIKKIDPQTEENRSN